MIGSSIRLSENRRKYIRKKKGEAMPPVVITIPSVIIVNITDSISLEYEDLSIKSRFTRNKTINNPADICRSYWAIDVFGKIKAMIIVAISTIEWIISLVIL